MTLSMSESVAQRKLVKWLRARRHEVVAVPNEQAAGPSQLGKYLAEGMVVGFPDLVVLPAGGAPALPIFIEMKSETGAVTEKQEQVHRRLRRRGYLVLVPYGIEDAKAKCLEAGL